MAIHIVQEGETLVRIADEYGHAPLFLWDHDKNKDLKAIRPNMNVLMPGDSLFIPDKRVDTVDCNAGQRHQFRRLGVPAILRVRLIVGGEPIANQQVRVDIDGKWERVMSDDDGVVELYIPTGAQRGRVVAEVGGLKIPFELRLGYLRPISEVGGVQDRLINLGYLEGPASGEADEETAAAVAAFQKDFALAPTGQVDEATADAIERAYATREDLSDESV